MKTFRLAVVLLLSFPIGASAQFGFSSPVSNPFSPAPLALAEAMELADCEEAWPEFRGATNAFLSAVSSAIPELTEQLLSSFRKQVHSHPKSKEECIELVRAYPAMATTLASAAFPSYSAASLIARCEVEKPEMKGATEHLLAHINQRFPGFLEQLNPPVDISGHRLLEQARKARGELKADCGAVVRFANARLD
jgi:hypothetical protein